MTTFSKIAKATNSFTKSVKSTVAYIKAGFSSFLLKQDGAYLLLEHGGKIILTQTSGGKDATDYTKVPK